MKNERFNWKGAFATALLLTATAVSSAQAETVGVSGDRFNLNVINNFYNGLPGVSSSILPGQLDSHNLSGLNLLLAVQPANDYTPGETATMQSYLASGGRIAFMGEHGSFAPNENNRITAEIALLGGHITITNDVIDGGFHDATVGNGQILNHPLTQGVNTYNYAAFAPLNISGPAQTLMLGINLTSVMMGYENIGAGSIFLITDQNVWDNVNQPTNNNARMFENLLRGNTVNPNTVPEPATGILLLTGTAALVAWRRFRS